MDHTLFLKGDKAPTEYFTGNVWLKPLVANEATFNCQIVNVIFEAGARTNWHTHSGGQILIITEGAGYYQEKGEAIQLLRKGDIVKIAPGVIHWHGANQDSELTHIAVNPNAQKGAADWLEKVSDAEYNCLKK